MAPVRRIRVSSRRGSCARVKWIATATMTTSGPTAGSSLAPPKIVDSQATLKATALISTFMSGPLAQTLVCLWNR